MFGDHLAYLLARGRRPYAAVLNVGKVKVSMGMGMGMGMEYGHVRSWEGINSVVLVMGSSSSYGHTGYVEFSCTCRASMPSGDVGSPTNCIWASWSVRIVRIVVLWLTS